MPGVFGFYGSEGDTSQALEAMAKSFRVDCPVIYDKPLCLGRFAASGVHLAHEGLVSFSGGRNPGLYCWVEGEAYDCSNIDRTIDSVIRESLSGGDLGQALLAAYGAGLLDHFLSGLNGDFCAVIYDAVRQKIFLISDRYGMRMLYWYHRDGVFAWASEVKAILALDKISKKINSQALTCFLDLGYLLGEQTWFQDIHLIKPATVMEFDVATERMASRYYWTWSEIQPSDMGFDEAVEELGQIFLHAVARRFNPQERIGIALSGGLDSRALLAAVTRLFPDYPGYAYTFGGPGCHDIDIARQVVSKTGWRHEIFHFSAQDWFARRIPKVWDTDGMLDMTHMHGCEFLPTVKHSMDINLNGYLGDVVCGGGWLGRIPPNKRANAANLSGFYGKYGGLANLEDVYFDTDHGEPGLYISRARRFTNMGAVNNLTLIPQRKPFFDNKLIELVFSLPESYRRHNRLYSAMLQKMFPEFFRDIPWQKTGKPAGVMKKPSVVTRACKRVAEMISNHFGVEPTSNKNYTNYPEWIRSPGIADQLEGLLKKKGGCYATYTDVDFFKRYLLPHLGSRSADCSNQILRAATFEIYFRMALRGEFRADCIC